MGCGGGAAAVVSQWPEAGGGALALIDPKILSRVIQSKDDMASPHGIQCGGVKLKAKTISRVGGIRGSVATVAATPQ